MNIDIGKIINDKLETMKKERVIENKIEEVIEKTILSVVTEELSGYSFKRKISEQLEQSIHDIAGDVGLSAYNGFIAEKVKEIVSREYERDLVDKISDKISNCLLKKYENIKLSDIFNRYREWLLDTIDEAEKYEYQRYCAELEVDNDGYFKTYKINLSEKELDYAEKPQISIKILVCGNAEAEKISSVSIDGRWFDSTLRIGTLTEFEAFIVNLYYNQTKIILDVDDVDDSNYYDVDC